MTIPRQKAHTLWWFMFMDTKHKEIIEEYTRNILHQETLEAVGKETATTGCVLNKKSLCTRNVDVEYVREIFLHSARSSVRSAARKLDMFLGKDERLCSQNSIFPNLRSWTDFATALGLEGWTLQQAC